MSSFDSSEFGSCTRNSRNIVPLAIIFFVALGIRTFLFWQNRVIAADGISYISVAQSIFEKFDFSASAHFPPLFPILIGIFNYVTPYDEVSGKVVSTIMGSLLVIPLYFLGKELFSQRVGYIAAIVAALSPSLIAISGIVLSQSTYITLLVTALLLVWKAFQTNSYRMAFTAGSMFAASYLTRPEAVIVLAAVSAVFLLVPQTTRTTKESLKLLLTVWTSFFIIAFPYILLLHKVFGTWQLTGKSSVTLADSLGWYLQRPDLKREPGFAGLTYFDVIKFYPEFLWKNTLKNIPAAWKELPPHLWFLALLGLASSLFTVKKLRQILFLGAAISPIGIIIVFFWIDGHYFSPCVPILLIAGGVGLCTLESGIHQALARFGQPKLAESVPWGLLFGIIIALSAIIPSLAVDRNAPYHYSQDGARYDHKLIGLRLKRILPPKSKVMVKSGRIAFYGDFQRIDIPQANLEEILQAAKSGQARYLIADGTLFGARPQLEPYLIPLLTPQERLLATGPFEQAQTFPGGLKLVLLYKDPASVGVAVYEFPQH